MQLTEHVTAEHLDVRLRSAADGSIHRASLISSWDYRDAGLPEGVFRPPIETHIVGMADDRFYAQKGRERTLYILPKAAFVTRGKALRADGSGEAEVWIPCPQDAPRYLGGSKVLIICLSGGEEDRCAQTDCTGCRNPECLVYDGPQGHGAPSWHTLSPRGKVAKAWTVPR
jgi:hypothetical protein